jgi:hemolysin activation/secretion protein
VSLRHAVFFCALASGLASFQALAQECPIDDPGCSGGNCPFPKLPYEEFLPSAPDTRGGREIPAVMDRPFDPESGNRILVRGFIIEGVVPNPDLDLNKENVQAAADAAFMKESAGKPEAHMTVGHMQRVADAVTTFYRGRGYLVAKAFLPVQTVGADSLVRIQVIEGKITEIVVENAKDYDPNVLKRPSKDLVGAVPTRDEVESALLYTQDNPGVRLFGTFRPGAATGETKLILQVLEEDSFGYAIGADNYGNEFTGTYRARVDAIWKNSFGFGDQFDLTVLQATSPSNTTFGALTYRVPIGPRGFSVVTGFSQNQFAVAGPLELLDLEGTTTIMEIGADWRFQRYRFSNAKAGLLIANKASELTAVGGQLPISDDKYTVAIAEISGDRIDTRFKGVDQGTFKIRQGVAGDFGGSDVDESFNIMELRYVRLQSLGETSTGIFRLRTQQTSNVLSPLEQFALAGPDSVRAFPVGSALTDTGIFASAEYRVQAPGFARSAGPFGRSWGDLLSVLLFYDYSTGKDTEGNEPIDLTGYGLGFQFGVPGTFNLLVQGAKPVSSPLQGDEADDTQVYGELSFRF